MKNYYKILGIPKNAAPEEVKRAYFGLVRKFPPDRYPKEFMQIREAYEVLIDDNTRKQYDSTDSMPDIVKKYLEAGREALEYDQPERAIELLERVIRIYPGFSVVNSLLGDAYYKNGNSGKATAIFEKLADDEPNNAGFAGKLAHAYLSRGWHKKAINQFRHALRLDEDNISLWIGMIQCYAKAKDFVSARTIALKALEISKVKGWSGLELYYHLIHTDILTQDFAALQEHLEEMKEIARKDENEKENVAWFLASVGKMLLRYDDPEKAETLLNAAFELAPGNEEIRNIKEKAESENRLLNLIDELGCNNSFHRIFADMFRHEMNKCNDPDCFDCIMEQLAIEMQVIVESETLRRQIIRLKTAFPELYQMKKQFFDQVLDERKIGSMYYTYKKKLDKMAKDNPEEFGELGLEHEEDEEEYEVQQPARRDESKVGRNDPCPCGSGKKYKKCCLK